MHIILLKYAGMFLILYEWLPVDNTQNKKNITNEKDRHNLQFDFDCLVEWLIPWLRYIWGVVLLTCCMCIFADPTISHYVYVTNAHVQSYKWY